MSTRPRYYRVDKVGPELRGRLIVDDTLYIEVKTDSRGRTYYLMVEDYSPTGNVYRTRIRKSVAISRIRSGLYAEITP